MMNALSLRFLLVILFVLLTGWSIGASLPVVAGLAGIAAALTARRLFAARQTPVPTPGPFRPPSPGRLSLDDLQHAALIIDPAEDVVARNFQAQDLLGGSVGDPVRLVLRHPMALEGARAAMTSDEAVEREVSGIGRADNIHHLHAIRLGDGRVLLTLADISQVRAAERMRVDFVANASHELRTPLATVAGFVETLQGPAADDPDAQKRFLALMADEAARMTRLIDDLLSLSRIELDKNVRPRRLIWLAPLLGEFTELIEMRVAAAGRELTVQIDEDLPPVLADHDQLIQVLDNLLSNALKYGRDGTPVTLGARRVEGGVRLSVTDEGDGIEAEHLPRLTERFYRVDASRLREQGGTGLGLAIVKHIVERHRGRLDIRSEPGKGTTVSVTLSAAPEAAIVGPRRRPPAGSALPSARTTNQTITQTDGLRVESQN